MYLIYVDESGDPGMLNSPTKHFVLSGLVIHETRWNAYLDNLVAFRKRMRNSFGLRLKDEIHAAHFISSPGAVAYLRRDVRLSILRFFIDEIKAMTDFRAINVVVNKQSKAPDYDVFRNAWRALIQRFSNTMAYRNFPSTANPEDCGLVIPDQTNVKKLTTLLRQMRRFNPVPNQQQYGPGYRNLRIRNMVEDPFFKDSSESYFIQAADLVAYFLYQEIAPNSYIRRKGARQYFGRLAPIYCRQAAPNDPRGIVWL